MSPFSRRAFLLGSASAAVLAACGGGDDATVTTPTPTTADLDALVLGVAFDRNGGLAAAIPQRAPFLVLEASGGLVPDPPAELAFTIGTEGVVNVARHGDDIQRPFYPLEFTFPAPGTYAVTTEVDGQTIETSVVANAVDGLLFPQVGDPMRGAPTPTVGDPLGFPAICTAEPPCPLHEVSLDVALAEGRPLGVLVSTPAFCAFQICGPVLDVLVAAAPAHPDMRLLHIEVYPSGSNSEPSLVVGQTLGLHFEPALFGVDAGGVITSRLDNIFDGPELDAALTSASA